MAFTVNRVSSLLPPFFPGEELRQRCLKHLCLLLFSLACSLSLTIPLLLEGKSVTYCCIAAIPFSALVYVVVYLLSCVSLNVDDEAFKNPLVLFCCVAGSLMVVWTVGFFVLFPGCFSTDSTDILKMIWGIPFESDWFRYDSLNNHHPAFIFF